MKNTEYKIDNFLDCCGLYCPLPIIKAQETLNQMSDGQILKIIATDDNVISDFKFFCKAHKLKLLHYEKNNDCYTIIIQK